LGSHFIVANGTKFMKVVLELQEQLANVRRVTVRHDIVIGRGSDCNLRLSAPQMSRRHCFLRVGRDGVSVTDLDSSNGTYVDNQRIKPGERVELKTGSILTLGPVNFIVHLKEDSGSTTRTEGERSRKSTKSSSGAAESSTIVSSAAAIIAQELKSKPLLDYSVEQAGASAEAHEETARMKKDRSGDAAGKRPSSTSDSSQSRSETADVAAPAGKKAVAAAVIASAAAPIAEKIAKPEPVDASSFADADIVDSVSESIGVEESQSAAESATSESSWLTDDSPDDLSFFGGQSSDEAPVAANDSTGSPATGAFDDGVEEVVEVLDDEDIFAEEVVEAVLAEESVEAVEVLDDEPVEVLDEFPIEAVEILDDETSPNALTADFEAPDLLEDQFLEVLDEPEVLAEELAEADLIEVTEETAEVVEVLDDVEPVEVMEAVSAEADPIEADLVEVLEEPSDFFDQLGIVEDEPEQMVAPIAVGENVWPAGEVAAEPVEAELIDEPAEAVQVLEEEAAVEVLDEPSDFFDMLGIEVEAPQEAIEHVAAVEVADSAEEWLEEPTEAALVEEPAQAVQVPEEEAAVEVLDEPSDFFDMLGIEVEEPQEAVEHVAAVEVADSAEEWLEEPTEAALVEEPAQAVQVLEEEAAVEVLDEPSDFFDMLGIEVETPQVVIEQVDAVEPGDAEEESSEIDWFADASENVVDAVAEQPAPAAVDDVELFDDVDQLEDSAPDMVTPEQAAALVSESSWDAAELSDVAVPNRGGDFDFLSEDPEAVAAIAATEIEPVATASLEAIQENAVVEEFAEIDAETETGTVEEAGTVDEIEAVEEFDFFDDVEPVQPVAIVEHAGHIDSVDEFDAELEEIELFEEVADSEIVAESETSTEPVAEATEMDFEAAAADDDAWDFAEIAAEEVVTTDESIPEAAAVEEAAVEEAAVEEAAEEEAAVEEVLEVAEEDEGSNWFDMGDDKDEDEDDPELRKFLKGF
jgi:pSer/pThr/pTyr-binding forkhead associated (FHA) protein